MTTGDALVQLQQSQQAALNQTIASLAGLQSWVAQTVQTNQNRINQLNSVDLVDANQVLADMTAAGNAQGVTDATALVADVNAEISKCQAAINAANALLPTS